MANNNARTEAQLNAELERLRDAESRWRSLIDNTPTLVTIVNRQGELEYANHPQYKARPEFLAGTSIFNYIKPDYHDIARNAIKSVLESGQPAYFESVATDLDGKAAYYENHLGPVYRDGKIAGVSFSSLDVTERRKAQDALRKSEESYRSLIESMGEGLAIANEGDVLILANPAAERIFGVEPGRLVGRHMGDFLNEQDLQQIQDNTEIRKQGKITTYELAINRPDGQVRHLRITGSPSFDKSGEYQGGIGIIRDITEQKLAEEARRTSEKLLKQLAENIRGVFWLVSVDWSEVYYISPAYEDIWGRSMESLYLKPLSWLDAVLDEDHEQVQAEITRRSLGGISDPYFPEYRIRKPDGSIRWIQAKAFPVEDETGAVYRIAGICEDITDRRQAEDELRRTQFAIDHASDAVYWIREDGTFASVNRAACDLLGYEQAEFLKLTMPDINPTIDQSSWRDKWIALKAHKSLRFETIHKRRDGAEIPIEIAANFVVFSGTEYSCAFARDITDRKKAEMQLRRTQYAVDFASDSYYWLKPGGWIEHVNEATCKTLGYTREELLTMNVYDIDPDITPETVWDVWEYQKQVKARRFEALSRRKDGALVPMELVTNYVNFEGEEYTCVFARDISERKQAEEQLRRTQYAFDHTSDAAYWIHPNGKLQHVNAAACALLGYTREELISLSLIDIDPFITAENADQVWQQLKENKAMRFETQHIRKDGTSVPIEISSNYVNFEGEEYSCAFARDISERKKMEEQIQQKQKLEAIGTLAGGIAHDFNNILFAVMGNAELALELLPESSMAYQNVGYIVQASKRAAELVKQLLAFSRPTTQKRVSVRVKHVVDEVLRMVRATLPTTVKIEQQFNVVDAQVMADVTELHQVILNLCTNAGQAMLESGGKLTVSLDELVPTDEFFAVHSELTPGRYIQLSVEDTGCGMTQDVLQRVFEPFFTTRDVSEGTGMGLAVVHGIVNSLGGVVTVVSKPGQGSTFTVYLPASIPQATAAAARIEATPTGTEHILVVDDEQRITTVLTKLLGGLGYEVTAYMDSSAALAAFAADPARFDLVLSDQTMPDITGGDLAKKLLRLRPEIPIVLMTGYSQVLSREVAQRIGVRDYLMKPVTKQNLAMTIRNALDNK